MTSEPQQSELEKAIEEMDNSLCFASAPVTKLLHAQSKEIERLNKLIDTITTDANYEGGVQFWIRKHDKMMMNVATLLSRLSTLKSTTTKG